MGRYCFVGGETGGSMIIGRGRAFPRFRKEQGIAGIAKALERPNQHQNWTRWPPPDRSKTGNRREHDDDLSKFPILTASVQVVEDSVERLNVQQPFRPSVQLGFTRQLQTLIDPRRQGTKATHQLSAYHLRFTFEQTFEPTF